MRLKMFTEHKSSLKSSHKKEQRSEVTFDLNDSGKVVGLTWAGEYKFKKLGNEDTD